MPHAVFGWRQTTRWWKWCPQNGFVHASRQRGGFETTDEEGESQRSNINFGSYFQFDWISSRHLTCSALFVAQTLLSLPAHSSDRSLWPNHDGLQLLDCLLLPGKLRYTPPPRRRPSPLSPVPSQGETSSLSSPCLCDRFWQTT